MIAILSIPFNFYTIRENSNQRISLGISCIENLFLLSLFNFFFLCFCSSNQVSSFLNFLHSILQFDSINVKSCTNMKKSGCRCRSLEKEWSENFFETWSHLISIRIRKRTGMAHVGADDEGGERKKKAQPRIQKQIMRRSCATPRPPNGQFVFADCLYLGTLSWTKIAVSSFL